MLQHVLFQKRSGKIEIITYKKIPACRVLFCFKPRLWPSIKRTNNKKTLKWNCLRSKGAKNIRDPNIIQNKYIN
jgi:hypothetical protein